MHACMRVCPRGLFRLYTNEKPEGQQDWETCVTWMQISDSWVPRMSSFQLHMVLEAALILPSNNLLPNSQFSVPT